MDTEEPQLAYSMSIKKLSPEYMAGFIDGEGHIGIVLRSKRNADDGYMPVLTVCNTDQRVLRSMWDTLGIGRWVEVPNINHYTGRPTLYRLIVTRAEALKDVLEILIPHLVIKQKQAELVLRFLNSRLERRGRLRPNVDYRGTSPPYSKKEIAIYRRLETMMPRGHKNRRYQKSP